MSTRKRSGAALFCAPDHEKEVLSRNEIPDNRTCGTLVPAQTSMHSQIAPTDEYILAAFLSGQLPDPLRQEIIAYLTQSGQARDILAMARDAMDSVDSGDGMAESIPQPSVSGDGHSRVEATASVVSSRKRLDERTMWKVTAVFAGAVLVLALIVMALVLDPSRRIADGGEWAPSIAGDNLELRWPAVPGATSYHVLHFESATHQSRVLAAVEGPNVVLARWSPTVSGQISILALNDAGKIVGRSAPLDVSLR